jgi:SAM-dependent methyltransferase
VTRHPGLHARGVEWVDATLARADALLAARPDLQSAFPPQEPRSAEAFWHWLGWHGPEEAPDVVAGLPALPPRPLRDRVVGAQSGTAFVRSGLTDCRRIVACLRAAGFDPARGGDVLDFGAGCGRLLRHFAFFADACTFTALDVDREAVDWLGAHLGFATSRCIAPEPPVALASESQDAVYSFSVFTHLPEARQLAWLEELRRVCRPGAALVLTTHGARVEQIVREGSAPHLPSADLVFAAQNANAEGDYCFVPDEAQRGLARRAARRARAALGAAPVQHADYGISIIRESYVRRRWTQLFELVEYLAAPDGYQDYVVLRRT